MAENTDITIAEDNLFSGLPKEVFEQLTPAKNRMILLYITGQYTITQIAKLLGIHNSTVSSWLRQEDVQMVIKELQTREYAIIDSSLKALRMKAVETMNTLLDSPMEPVRFQASKDILDRTGHKPVNEMKIDKTVTTIEKQLQELADITIDEAEIIDISDVIEQVIANE